MILSTLFFKNTGPYGLLAGFYLLTMLLGSFIPYGVAAVIMSPIALLCSHNIRRKSYPYINGNCYSCKFSLSSPKASSSNTLIMTAGEYRPKDFALMGISSSFCRSCFSYCNSNVFSVLMNDFVFCVMSE